MNIAEQIKKLDSRVNSHIIEHELTEKEPHEMKKRGRPRKHPEYYTDGVFDKKIYNQLNKDKISDYGKEKKETCGCGTTYRINNRARHKRTPKHIEFEAEIKQNLFNLAAEDLAQKNEQLMLKNRIKENDKLEAELLKKLDNCKTSSEFIEGSVLLNVVSKQTEELKKRLKMNI